MKLYILFSLFLKEFRIDDIEKKICKIDDENKADADTEEKDKRIQELEKILSYHKDVSKTKLNFNIHFLHSFSISFHNSFQNCNSGLIVE